MADIIDYKILAAAMQTVEIELSPGEGIRAETGAMLYMEDGIGMQTNRGGGLFSGFKRMITGESFFITTFLYHGSGKGHVGFAAPLSRYNNFSRLKPNGRPFFVPKGCLFLRRFRK